MVRDPRWDIALEVAVARAMQQVRRGLALPVDQHHHSPPNVGVAQTPVQLEMVCDVDEAAAKLFATEWQALG